MHSPRVDAGRCPRTRTPAAPCDRCEKACPKHCIKIHARSIEIGEGCTACGACHAVCPTGALRDPLLDDLEAAERALRLRRPRFHCARAQPQEESVEVSCLARITAATLVALARGGAREVTMITGGCSGCEQETGRRVAFARSFSAGAEILAACKLPPLALRERERPERQARSGAASCSRRAFLGRLRGGRRRAPRGAAMALHALLAGSGELELPQAPVGRPSLQGSCDACGLCARLCPTATLIEKRADRRFSLARSSRTCVGCGTCAAVCAFDSIRVDPVWDPAEEETELVAFALAACRDCGAPIRAEEDRCVPCGRRRGLTPGRTSPSCAAG